MASDDVGGNSSFLGDSHLAETCQAPTQVTQQRIAEDQQSHGKAREHFERI